MKNKRKFILVLFLSFTVINTGIFFHRNNFIYHKKGNYSTLYSSDTIKWKQFVYDYPADEFEKAKQILNDSIKVPANASAQQVLEISSMLINRFNKQSGRPSDELLSSSPLKQYQMLCSSDTQKIWCGVYAGMFAFFCWAKGIPCRFIEIMNPNDHHVLNECYLRETGEWAMVDLTYNKVLIRDHNKNRYVNFFHILNPLKGKLTSLKVSEDSIISTSFEPSFYNYYLAGHPPVLYYYRINNFEVYKPVEKAKRYLLPSAWYEEVNTTGSNFLFYVKELFILLWLISLIILLIPLLKKKKISYRNVEDFEHKT